MHITRGGFVAGEARAVIRSIDGGPAVPPGRRSLLTVGGAVGRPGVLEVPIGTPLGTVLSVTDARPPSAVVTGGYHGTWLAPRFDLPLSRAGLAAAGGALGAGVVLVLDESTCALGELARVASWLAGQSARQCGPCMFGLEALARDVADLSGYWSACTSRPPRLYRSC